MFKIQKIAYVIVACLFSITIMNADEQKKTNNKPNVDLIIFSYNRPLQLYAYLESVQKYVTGLKETFLLYRAGNDDFEKAYQEVFKTFTHVKTFRQVSQPPQISFKPLLLEILLKHSHGDYILFGVDDNLVTDSVDINTCVQAIEQTNAYGFYLRHGFNTTQCYTLSIEQDQPLPPLKEVAPDIFAWQFKTGTYDWNYPNSLDMTLFRKKDIQEPLITMDYKTPNTLDVTWDHAADRTKIGLCFKYSKMLNIPLNIVQENKIDRNMEFLSPEELLECFNEGLKLDIAPLHQMRNKAPHMPYVPNFIKRTNSSSPVLRLHEGP